MDLVLLAYIVWIYAFFVVRFKKDALPISKASQIVDKLGGSITPSFLFASFPHFSMLIESK